MRKTKYPLIYRDPLIFVMTNKNCIKKYLKKKNCKKTLDRRSLNYKDKQFLATNHT